VDEVKLLILMQSVIQFRESV